MCNRAPEKWELWEHVPSQFKNFAATFGQQAEIASEIGVHQPKLAIKNGDCLVNWSKSPKKIYKKHGNRDNLFKS